MQIKESELRGIVRDEMMKTGASRKIREAAAPAAGGNLAYKAKPGDTISALVQKFYGIPANKAGYVYYNQIAKLSGLASADKVLAVNDTLQFPPTLGGKPRTGGGAAAPAAAGAAPKGKQCDLPSYKDSLTTALGKAGVAGMAMSATIDLIIFGRFYNATAAGLSAIANNLRTAGSSALGAAAGVLAQMTTLGASELVKNLIIGFCDGWSTIISGCTNAKTKFSRTCDFTTFANETGSAWGQGLQAMFAGVKGGISAVLAFLKTGAQALAGALASAGLAALGLTGAVIIGLVNGLAKLIQMGAAAVQSLLSSAIIAAGKVLAGAGQAVSAVGGGMQAAGGAVQATGQAMKEGRGRRGTQRNESMQKFADDLLHASTVSRYLASLDESTRRVIVAASI
jgi:hypothetical protein